MAECSYARCLQERRYIKRELMKWSKDMLLVFGLERVAEELMGHKKWKQYQEALIRTQFNTDNLKPDQADILNEQLSDNTRKNTDQESFDSFTNNIKSFDVNDRNSISPLTKIVSEKIKNTLAESKRCFEVNNCSTLSHSISCKSSKDNTGDEDNQSQSPKEQPPLEEALDWKPNDKCYFCDAGKLFTVNEKGDLVAESSPALSEADQALRLPPGETESDSSDSVVPQSKDDAKKAIASQFKESSVLPNMTSLDSMAAQWSGFQSSLGQLYPCILYNLTQQVKSATPTTSETSAAAASPPQDSPSPSDLTGEQPLDLSSKPSPNSLTGGDAGRSHRTRARMVPISGRRTYTEEELNNALQDIISGKLGTRRAAVQYNIPRSTLRNKVYKISSGPKRDTPTSLRNVTSLEDLADIDYDKQDLSGDEEDSNGDRDRPLNSSSLKLQQQQQPSDDLASRLADASVVQKLNLDNKSTTPQQQSQCHPHDIDAQSEGSASQQKLNTASPQLQPQQSPAMGNTAWQNVLLHSLLLSGGLPMQNSFEETVQIFNTLLMKPDLGLLNSQLSMQLQQSSKHSSTQQQEPHQTQTQTQTQSTTATTQKQQCTQSNQSAGLPAQAIAFLPKSETPETESSVELNEALGDDPSVILRIPSYKSVALFSNSTSSPSSASVISNSNNTNNNTNFVNMPQSSPKIPTPSTLGLGPNKHTQKMHSSVSSTNNIAITSPSQSPPTLSLRDVIANSISRTFNQQSKHHDNSGLSPAHSTSSALDNCDPYKRPSISVIKNIGGTDTSRFATAPNMLGNHLNSNHHQHHHNQNLSNSSLAGGKGTRPKRGKYRNYDRDSLVEAVKAVQRGEMSVHRAGSYYGVPHSTLEYKVKERHLMRPRKREPKSQPPLDDRTADNSNISGSAVNTQKSSNMQGLPCVGNMQQMYTKGGSSNSSTSLNQMQSASGKSNTLFPKTSPNGIKVPSALFEQSLAAQLQYPPHLFWQGGLAPLHMDLNARSQAAAAAAAAAASGPAGAFASNSELLKSQMLQRFHQEHLTASNVAMGNPSLKNVLNNPVGSGGVGGGGGSSGSSSSGGGGTNNRGTTDNLFDSQDCTSGSFLDGIIRKTLDRKSIEGAGAAVSDPVNTKNTNHSRLSLNNERTATTVGDFQKMKRSGSSVPYHHSIEIKRERASPICDYSNSDSEKNNRQYSTSESNPLPSPSIREHIGTIGMEQNLRCENNISNAEATAAAALAAAAAITAAVSKSAANSSLNINDQISQLGTIKSETEDSL